jgi:hypothetical protein
MVHPFMLHAASQNHSGNPRFIGNRKHSLKDRMKLHRENPADYSPVEAADRYCTAVFHTNPALIFSQVGGYFTHTKFLVTSLVF